MTALASTSTTRQPTKSRAPRTTPPSADPQPFENTLLCALPASYREGTCQPARPPATGALATVDCGEATVPTGPKAARYSFFADQETLDQHFKDAIAQNSELVRCPGSDLDSPTAWNYNANPEQMAGQVACGTYDGNPDVTWTNNADLLLGDAQGPNLEDLHNWWNQYG